MGGGGACRPEAVWFSRGLRTAEGQVEGGALADG